MDMDSGAMVEAVSGLFSSLSKFSEIPQVMPFTQPMSGSEDLVGSEELVHSTLYANPHL